MKYLNLFYLKGIAHRILNVLLITSQKLAKVKCGNYSPLTHTATHTPTNLPPRHTQMQIFLKKRKDGILLCLAFSLAHASNKNGRTLTSKTKKPSHYVYVILFVSPQFFFWAQSGNTGDTPPATPSP